MHFLLFLSVEQVNIETKGFKSIRQDDCPTFLKGYTKTPGHKHFPVVIWPEMYATVEAEFQAEGGLQAGPERGTENSSNAFTVWP